MSLWCVSHWATFFSLNYVRAVTRLEARFLPQRAACFGKHRSLAYESQAICAAADIIGAASSSLKSAPSLLRRRARGV